MEVVTRVRLIAKDESTLALSTNAGIVPGYLTELRS